jgi:predicted MFS family arabinose efflux permease
VSAVGAPDIERAVASSHAGLAAVLLVVPGVISLVLEPVIFLLADRYPRRWFIRGGIAAMAVSSVAAALAPGAITLALALGAVWVATGAAASLAQATLVDRSPPELRARTIARWTMLALVGDIAAPALLAGLAAIGHGWRTGFAIAGGVLALGFAALVASPLSDAGGSDDEAAPSLWQAFTSALRDRDLMLWLLGLALCDLLDEVLVVFASLHVRDDLGAGPIWQSVVVGCFIAGGALGLVVLERVLVRVRELTAMVWAAAACAAVYLVWLAMPTAWASALLIIPVGATAAPLYPLAASQAYARRPGQSGAVLAASHLFTPLGLALPWLLGAAADRWGTYVALALLVVEPIGLALLALRSRAHSDRQTPAT